MTAKTATSKNRPCACQNFEAHTADMFDAEGNENSDAQILTTGCTRQTTNTFAQGHDAKLVSFLIEAQMAGLEIFGGRTTGVLTSYRDAESAAYRISGPLGEKAARAIEARQAKIAKQAERLAAKAARKAAKRGETPAELDASFVDEQPADAEGSTVDATETRPMVRIKVGRWFYDAIINDDRSATYSASNGNPTTVEFGKYTEV